MTQSFIHNQRADILARINTAAIKSGRTGEDITLIAVSKQQPDRRISDMLAEGQTVFGENRVQEAQNRWRDRFGEARPGIKLHLIGPLQTNKTRAAVELFDVIQTLDREKLAKALVRAMENTGKTPELFVQVNTGEEPQKAGVRPQEVDNFIKTLRAVYDLHPCGLMCIPPMGTANSGQAAGPHFALLRKLAVRNGLAKLSMGMSADFETAIAFGATHVRVGSALFGPREPRQAPPRQQEILS
ncbi:MAG TPA: YggS family pyridoxal phosphate-dependent enzyme [Hellea balneolensis]|uniref:Pyridoxal phosphate homeostasis protein n=1 Tax=Hellea balneolensis TaxID=287478 RepID=A0A7V5NX64_9PROT|nr:YggS family pyridoxal phosphate-dependent enzyme [Hellea balneolensis]